MIAVGGTTLLPANNARHWTETVWSVYAKPKWQTDKLCAMRMEADISVIGDPYPGVMAYAPTGHGQTSGWLIFGGTGTSAPIVAGIFGATGAKPNGAAKIWVSQASLNYVISGNNGRCGGAYFCVAGKCYDGPSGNGTPAGPGAF